MKRQGIEGFTFDSEAEEWAAWVASKTFMYRWQWTRKMKRQMREYGWRHFKIPDWYVPEPRHSPAQQQKPPETGEGSHQPRERALWPLLAFSVACILGGAWASGWL